MSLTNTIQTKNPYLSTFFRNNKKFIAVKVLKRHKLPTILTGLSTGVYNLNLIYQRIEILVNKDKYC